MVSRRRSRNYTRLPKSSLLKEEKEKQFIGEKKEEEAKGYLKLFRAKLSYQKYI
jgi:hypothetical protein